MYNTMYLMGLRTEREFDKYLEKHWFEEGVFTDYQKKFSHDVYAELTTYQIDYIIYGPRERQNFTVDPEQAYPFLEKIYEDEAVNIYHIR